LEHFSDSPHTWQTKVKARVTHSADVTVDFMKLVKESSSSSSFFPPLSFARISTSGAGWIFISCAALPFTLSVLLTRRRLSRKEPRKKSGPWSAADALSHKYIVNNYSILACHLKRFILIAHISKTLVEIVQIINLTRVLSKCFEDKKI